MKIFKRLFCSHKYKTITNLHGDIINLFDGSRSIQKCVYCEKIKFNDYLDEQCKEINQY